MTKKIGKTIGLVAAAIILLLIAGAVYRTFFTPAYAGNGNVTGVLLFGLLTGGTIAFLILRLRNIRKTHASNPDQFPHSGGKHEEGIQDRGGRGAAE